MISREVDEKMSPLYVYLCIAIQFGWNFFHLPFLCKFKKTFSLSFDSLLTLNKILNMARSILFWHVRHLFLRRHRHPSLFFLFFLNCRFKKQNWRKLSVKARKLCLRNETLIRGLAFESTEPELFIKLRNMISSLAHGLGVVYIFHCGCCWRWRKQFFLLSNFHQPDRI